MSKDKLAKIDDVEELPTTAVHLTEKQTGKLVADLNNLTEEIEVTRDYFNLEEGEPRKCYYLGKTTMMQPETEKEVPAVDLLMDDGTFAIAAQAVIVTTLSKYEPMTPFKIIKTGEKKLAGGKTLFTFSIKALAASLGKK